MPTPAPIRADRASRVAEQLHATLRDIEAQYRSAPRTHHVADPYIKSVVASVYGEEIPVPPHVIANFNALPPQFRREILFTAQDAAVRRMWQRARITYEIDPDAWDSIGDANPKALVPPIVAERLPHANPLLVFPEPLVLDNGNNERQRVVGAYVSGACAVKDRPGRVKGVGGMLCSTDDPDSQGWVLTFAGLVEDAQGRPVMYSKTSQDVVWSRTTLILQEGDTLQDLMARSVNQFNKAMGTPKMAVGDYRTDLPQMMARAINMLVYLSAVNADLRPLPERSGPPRAKGKGPARLKPPKIVAVGFTVGAQLRAWRRAPARTYRGGATGRTVKPHVRRSHPHTYRYGPGRTESYVRWMWPIRINMKFGDAKKTTIITTKDPRKIRQG